MMEPTDYFTDFRRVSLPEQETAISRRFLKVITRWIPVGLGYFNDWRVRPNCGHFFGGVLWYGQETACSIFTLALAASSPEFDPELAGASAEELRQVALKGLRFLCFTHDTGPSDCVRPTESWGRTEPAGTKWGERGQGFFKESQCGRTIANLAVTAALIQELLGEEERLMLANIAGDYMDRFGEMAPKSGVYWNTQTEENAWTAHGMTACLMLLPEHERWQEWWQNAKLWMFRTATMPQDMYDYREFAEGKSVRDLCGRAFTTLPDGTGENHGFVHPSYMASAVAGTGQVINLLRLFGSEEEAPPHLFWHRKDRYALLKTWCDDAGAPHCVQGMDWPYFSYPGHCFLHAVANLYLHDADAALLERRALETVERSSCAHGGHMVPEETAKHCHGQQDPAIMRERMVASLAAAYLAHRLAGEGEKPPESDDLQRRLCGVYLYPHGGALVHRHPRGINSLAWRNRTMVLPEPRQGMKLIGPAAGSWLANFKVTGKAESTKQVALQVREAADRACVVLIQHLAEESVRREVFFASLPEGKCLTAERLYALRDVTVEHIQQGYLSVINDAYFGEREDLRGKRWIFWEGGARSGLRRSPSGFRGERTFPGYPADSDRDDVSLDLGETGWVNMDDRCGIVFRGTGRAVYQNRHYFEIWHATEDALTLSLEDKPKSFKAGEKIAELIALIGPEEKHPETAAQELVIHQTHPEMFAAEVDGFLCACNFSEETLLLEPSIPIPAAKPVRVSCGVAVVLPVSPAGGEEDAALRLSLHGREPVIVEIA